MSRYRSEETSLRVRVNKLRDELALMDRDGGEGLYAKTPFARAMYRLGLASARLWRRLREPNGATRVARLRAIADQLERRLAERQAAQQRDSKTER